MKKIFTLIFVISLMAMVLSGCGKASSQNIDKEKYEKYKEYLPTEAVAGAPEDINTVDHFTDETIEAISGEWLYGEYVDDDGEETATAKETVKSQLTPDWWYVWEIQMDNGDNRWFLMNIYTGDWIDDTGIKVQMKLEDYQ